MKNQKGFGAIELLLIIVLVGIIGGLGWFVYNQRKDKSSTTNNTTSTPATTTSTPKNTEYINKDFGFKFSYPSEWGKVAVTESSTNAKAGKFYDITFDGNFSKLHGAFVTKDWVAEDISDTRVGFVTYDGCKKASTDLNQVYLYQTDTTCVSVTGSAVPCPGDCGQSKVANIALESKFTKNQKIAGVRFFYVPFAVNDFKDETLKKAFDSYSIDSNFVDLAKTVQEL